MATITFDTLKFSKRLQEAGVPAAQANAEAEVLSEIFEVNLKDLVTKEDLQREIASLHKDLDIKFAKINGELKLLRWMLGFLIAGVASLVLKAFF